VIFDLIKRLKENPNELKILGTGEVVRDFTYVRDAADALINLIVDQACEGKVFNYSGGQPYSIVQLADMILELLELKGKMEQTWSIPADATEIDDVFDSLTALGYSVQEAREAISSINSPDLTTEEKIRMALEHITNR